MQRMLVLHSFRAKDARNAKSDNDLKMRGQPKLHRTQRVRKCKNANNSKPNHNAQNAKEAKKAENAKNASIA